MSPIQTPKMSDSSTWFSAYTKLRFFSRIRRFLKSKTLISKPYEESDHLEKSIAVSNKESEMTEAEATEGEVDESIVLQRSVKRLHFGSWEEKEVAAMEIKRLAEENVKLKKTMANLGVIPSLVSMVESEVIDCRSVAAVQALIELSNGSYTNKVFMVEAGILTKLPTNIEKVDGTMIREFTTLLLSISSLANSQFPLTSPQVLPFLTSILESRSSIETKELCLATIYNFSTMLDNAGPLVNNGLVHTLLRLSSVKETSEKALATLGNLVVTLMGKKAMENSPMVPESLIEILTWEERPKCQELSAYILMILAHQSSAQRQKMAKSGIVPVLLEVALLGSQLAQKRAMKLLQWFKDERQMKMGPHSGPQIARIAIGSPVNRREMQAGKKLMKKMVEESLHKNMEIITRRANASGDEASNNKLKALVISSSSKSLPY